MSNETTYNMKDKLGPVGEGLKATLPHGGTIECFFCEVDLEITVKEK